MASTYCVIMAGGIGSRFWPMSTAENPKQFHDILGTGESLLQQTFRRLSLLTDPEKILVVTHRKYEAQVAEQLPAMPHRNIILEPARRNTAPCIAYAAYRIQSEDPEANILIAPSDHLISNESEFVRIAKLALNTAENSDFLLTLGIKPHRPDTGYGYIQFESQTEVDQEVKKVKTFTEKPNLEIAQQFLDSGDFLWNAGIFIWSLKTFKTELALHQADLFQNFEQGSALFGTEEENSFVNKIYPSCENESIDYGLMEKSSKVFVIPADFGWSDLGTWGSLYEHKELDNKGNALIGSKILSYESEGNIVRMPKDKIAVIEGLKEYIIVDTPEALLICKMQNEQLIKTFVSDVKLSFGDDTGI
ncbi:mannose-1-phosphate guanylyltransferase [Croceimicrobium hydrocarbonivorans]|uniref:mannose-1-phosphate guanylyltransferase n=1 Tax=Croceimicrobium hydrocarbonivorans TaxID=2761580 RepID=A0A7H0VFG0_9FLAO|nr:mannose-1-phosphate guanylyltransferase [Croceimicrobium hydrocarbonivorans]QNR24458.1 mannose-1-phosphate guanylyltransferase [Croceimicrobium hydrocarbonivorans]